MFVVVVADGDGSPDEALTSHQQRDHSITIPRVQKGQFLHMCGCVIILSMYICMYSNYILIIFGVEIGHLIRIKQTVEIHSVILQFSLSSISMSNFLNFQKIKRSFNFAQYSCLIWTECPNISPIASSLMQFQNIKNLFLFFNVYIHQQMNS